VEAVIREWALHLATLIDGAVVLLIGLASIEAIVTTATLGWAGEGWAARLNLIRFRLSRRLALALELLIGSDIVRTAVEPTWSDLGQLGAIVALRVLIVLSLDYETKGARPETPAPNRGP
jgi:uncharacterized membrane protein